MCDAFQSENAPREAIDLGQVERVVHGGHEFEKGEHVNGVDVVLHQMLEHLRYRRQETERVPLQARSVQKRMQTPETKCLPVEGRVQGGQQERDIERKSERRRREGEREMEAERAREKEREKER